MSCVRHVGLTFRPLRLTQSTANGLALLALCMLAGGLIAAAALLSAGGGDVDDYGHSSFGMASATASAHGNAASAATSAAAGASAVGNKAHHQSSNPSGAAAAAAADAVGSALSRARRSISERLFGPAYTSQACELTVPAVGVSEPVYEHEDKINYYNTPISAHRVGNAYVCPPGAGTYIPSRPPILTVVTPAHNPKPVLWETYEFLRRQSMRDFQWVIVNDHSADPIAYQMLLDLVSIARQHIRVTLTNNTGPHGLPSARNHALNLPLAQTKYIAFLDDDDMLELTTYEKTTWLLESNPDMDMAGFYTIGFGASNFTWRAGFHKLDALYHGENQLCGTMTLRRVAVGDLRYDPTRTRGAEDWDFWLTMAEAGKWGYTIPENLYWYRQNPKAARMRRWPGLKAGSRKGGLADTMESIRQRHAALADGVPHTLPHQGRPWERQRDTELAHMGTQVWPGDPNEKHLLIIMPWLKVGGTERMIVGMMEYLASRGWRITVACTLYDGPDATAMRPRFMQWTHDIFILPDFLAPTEFPAFLRHLIASRKTANVLITNDQLGYELLPYLRKHAHPRTRFVDLVHAEQEGWMEGGYPWISTVFAEHLDRTIAISHHVKDFMVARGKPATQVGVIHPGVDTKTFQRSTRPNGNPDGPLRIVMVARLDEGKRPTVAVRAVAIAREAGANIELTLVGDGPMRTATEAEARKYGLLQAEEEMASTKAESAGVRLLGQLSSEETRKVLAQQDAFFLPTAHEGISIAVLEAMSLGLPALSTNTGGMPEIISLVNGGGALVPYTGNAERDAQAYAQVLKEWARHRALVARMAEQAVKVARSFDITALLEMWEPEFAAARTPVSAAAISVDAAAQLAMANAVRSHGPYVSMRHIEAARRVPPRPPGPGLELQRHCGEASPHMTAWINGFAEPKLCEETGGTTRLVSRIAAAETKRAPTLEEQTATTHSITTFEVAQLHLSAFRQCGSWCITDLSAAQQKQGTGATSGWEFTGTCFYRFGSSSGRTSPCDKA